MTALARALALAAFGTAMLTTMTSAQATERGRAGLFEQLASPDAQRAAALSAQAGLLLAEAQSAISSDWETTCRMTLALRGGSEAVASLRGLSLIHI